MDKRQNDIIIGTLLGDSYIHLSLAGTTSLSIKQADRYKEYVFWLFDNLKELFQTEPKQRPDTKQWYVRSKYSNELNLFRHFFYKNGRKIVPKNIMSLLVSPLSLAVWFMDDGTLDYRLRDHCAFHLCTNGFSKEETQILIDVLNSNFGIESSLHHTLCRGKRHPRIYIGAGGRDKFIKLITPNILDCFKYKLPSFRYTPQRLDLKDQIVSGETNLI